MGRMKVKYLDPEGQADGKVAGLSGGKGAWITPIASVASYSASLAFTDGDTVKRFTISNAAVGTTSKIIGMIRRPDSADETADLGYIYNYNIVRIGTGAFDILVTCLDDGCNEAVDTPPNETIQFHYMIG